MILGHSLSNDLQDWLSGFREMNPIEAEEEDTAQKKEHKLDLFKAVLPALDRRNIKYYSTLTDEQKKDISIWPLTRWMSSVTGNAVDQLFTVNEIANKNSKTFSSKKTKNALETDRHKELQWMLLAISGSGKPERHVWPGAPRGVKKNLLEEEILKFYPLINDIELELLLAVNTEQEISAFFKENGYDDKTIKELLKATNKE